MKKENKKNRKWLKRLGIGFGVFILLVAGIAIFFVTNPVQLTRLVAGDAADRRVQSVKSDDELLGTRFIVPREGKEGIEVNIYRPKNKENETLPAIFVVHGGGFFNGTADLLDSFSDRVKDKWNAMIITINYKKLDEMFIPYPAEEIRDTVLYFGEHSADYKVDKDKFATIGFSAGGYHVANASLLLAEVGFPLAGQVLAYPFLDSPIPFLAPNLMKEQIPTELASTAFVLAGQDPISDLAKPYEAILEAANIPVQVLRYEQAQHAFMEVNNPESSMDDSLKETGIVTPEQEELARQAEDDLVPVFNSFFENN